MPDRPAYAIPTMAEIAAVPPNGLTAISTFSGCGGSSLGLRWAGWRVAAASEFVPAAAEVYRLNFPGTPVETRDVREVTPDELADLAQVAPGEVDLLEGSPPCSSFSTAGKRERGWGQTSKYSDVAQRTDDLFLEFTRLLNGLQPRAFVAENVSGLRKGVARGYLKEILAAMRTAGPGYRVTVRELDASWLGVPQARRRLIFVGLRADVAPGVDPPHPQPLPYRYTLADAMGATGPLVRSGHGYFGGDLTHPDEPCITITASKSLSAAQWGIDQADDITHDPETGALIRFDDLALGAAYAKLIRGGHSKQYLSLWRTDQNRPCPTVTQAAGGRGTAGVTHPAAPRKFTLGELRRICGFPDDFQLTGSYQQRWERLGRAVPPPMYLHVGRAIADVLREDPPCDKTS